MTNASLRFWVPLSSKDNLFNSCICLAILRLATSSFLHAVDKSNRYKAARFLSSECTSFVWSDSHLMWVQPYLLLPNIFVFDQGSPFNAAECKATLTLHDIQQQPLSFASLKALRVMVRDYDYLRRSFEKAVTSAPCIPMNTYFSVPSKVPTVRLVQKNFSQRFVFSGIAPPIAPTAASSK